MKVFATLVVCALAAVSLVDATGSAALGASCGDGAQTPVVTTLAPTPTTGNPGQTTPAPTSGKPVPTTPEPSTAKPGQTSPPPSTPAPTTPAPTTPPPSTPAPTTPAPTTPAPTTLAPGKFDKNQEYDRDGVNCNGFLRLPAPGSSLIRTDCVLDYKVQFAKTDTKVTDGCVVCPQKFVYDNTVDPKTSDVVPLCGGLPLCTRFRDYAFLTEADLMCVLYTNGAGPVNDVCAMEDN